MKISELISKLTAARDEHGNVEVFYLDDQYTHYPHDVVFDCGVVFIRSEGV